MHNKTLTELAQALQQRQCSSVELTRYFLDRIERYHAQLNCFITVTAEVALAQAQVADRRLQAGEANWLTGIPIAHKDIFCTRGIKTSCGSKMLDNFIAPYNATVIEKCQTAGLVMLGKTNMDEFAMGSSNLSRFDGVRFGYRCQNPTDIIDLYKRSRGEGFGAEVKRRIMVGTYALSAGYYDAYYLQAPKIRRLISQDFAAAFQTVDVILGPTSPTTAFNLGEKTDDPVKMYLSDIYTIPVNLAGLPAISIPVGFIKQHPVGMQLIGNYLREAQLLNIAHQYQQRTAWHNQIPSQFA